MKETIFAPATAPGKGSIAILRISGPDAYAALEQLIRPVRPGPFRPREMRLGHACWGGEDIDQVLCVFFPAPHSYTGEPMAEIQCHGGNMAVSMLMQALGEMGLSPAQPGEFSKRAFLNGKMDLSQAEAVQDYISALSQQSAKQALRQMGGSLQKEVQALQNALTDALAQTEAAIQYPEEDLEEQTAADLQQTMGEIKTKISRLLATYDQAKAMKEGFHVALLGKPNVGKSSLLNCILGEERAIVTDIPGTTRDILQECFLFRSLPIFFADTAGLRETEDLVEQMGVARSHAAADAADLALFLFDCPPSGEEQALVQALKEKGVPCLLVQNKTDQPNAPDLPGMDCRISAKTEAGVQALLQAIYEKAMGNEGLLEGTMVSNQRQKAALLQAKIALQECGNALESGLPMDLAAIDLKAAWDALGEITGSTLSEEIINRIFDSFCLGK